MTGGNGVLDEAGTGSSSSGGYPATARDRIEYLPVLLAVVLMALLAAIILPLDSGPQSGSAPSDGIPAGEESGPVITATNTGPGAVVAVVSILLVPVVLAGFPLVARANRRKAWLVSAALLTLFVVIFLLSGVGLFALPSAVAAWFVWRRTPPDS